MRLNVQPEKSSSARQCLIKKGEGNLPKDSVVNISQVITVNKSDLTGKIGSLPPAKLKEIIEGVKLLIEPREL